MHHLNGRGSSVCNLAPDTHPGLTALLCDQPRPDECRHHNKSDSRPHADERTGVQKQDDLDDRNDQECREQPCADAHVHRVGQRSPHSPHSEETAGREDRVMLRAARCSSFFVHQYHHVSAGRSSEVSLEEDRCLRSTLPP